MSKKLSTVYLLLITLLLFTSGLASAQSTGTSTSIAPANEKTAKIQENAQTLREAKRLCHEATQSWNSVVTEFTAACGAGVGLGVGSDLVKCAEAVKCCLEADNEDCKHKGNNSLSADADRLGSVLEELQERMSALEKENPQYSQLQDYENQQRSLKNRISLYQRCPMRGAVGIDEAYEEAEEARDKLEEREDAINDLQQQINEAQAKLEEDKLKIENEMKKLEADTKKDLKEIKDQEEEATQRLLEQIEAKQTQMRELQRAIAGEEAKKAGAYEGLQQRITEMKVGCYEEAVQKAQRARQQVIQKAANNEYSAGSMETLYNSVGSSTMEDTQKLVEYHRKLCENSYPFKESIKSAQQSYASQVRTADKSIAIFNEEIGLIRVSIGKLQTDDKLKIHQDTMEKIALLETAYTDGLEALQKQYMITVQAASRQIAQLQQQLAQKQAHLSAAQEHLQYKNSILDLQRRATGGGDQSISSEDWGKMIGGLAGVQMAAQSIAAYCPDTHPLCKSAQTFLSGIGSDVPNCQESYESSSGVDGTY